MKFTKTLTAAAIIAAGFAFNAQAADKMKIAMVVKTLGNGFFDAAHQGADEAAKELGNVEIIFTGPAKATAEGQIELINSLVAQKVDAIVVSANDPDALVPATKKAMGRGIKDQFVTGKAGKTVSLGRVGTATPDESGSAPMAEPFTYDATNVEKFAKFF